MPQGALTVVFAFAVVVALIVTFSIPQVQERLVLPPDVVYGLLQESRNKPPVEPTVHRDVIYKRTLMRSYRLDVYEPLSEYAPGHAPAIVFFHGGSWLHGDKETIRVVDRFLRRMREQGYFVIAANYTTTALRGIRGPAAVTEEVVRWVVRNSDEFGYDRERIGLYGVSAGAHLALLAAGRMDLERYPLAFVFAECAPTDLIAMREGDAFDRSNVFSFFPEFRLRELSPVSHVSADLPPILLLHGGADRIVHIDQSERYADAAAAAGVDVEFYRYPEGNHAFLNLPDHVWYQQETLALDYFERKFAAMDG
ncbi:MAG: alpha/beta hydrolase [Spirochaetales bacterium]